MLVVSGISKTYSKNLAVDQLSFSVEAGKCVALLGPNGAGKSTTLEIISGNKEPDSGSVSLFGFGWSNSRKKIYEKLGVLFQETNLYKKFTIKESLDLFASFYEQSTDLDSLIDSFDLREHLNKRVEALSGGIKQRFYIACAYVNDPDLILLDEPTTGLDPQSRRYIWDKVAISKGQGKAILLTTHYMEEAEHLADDVIIVDNGKMIAHGSPKQLIEKYCQGPRISFVLDKEEESLKEKVAAKLGRDIHFIKGDLSFKSESLDSEIQTVTQISKEMDIKILKLSVFNPSLEEVFIQLTGKSIRDA